MAEENDNKFLTIQERLKEKEMAYRNHLFKRTLTKDQIKDLSIIIYQCLQAGKPLDYIKQLTGLSVEQIHAIQTEPEYYRSIHSLVDEDARVTQTMLRSYKLEAVEALMKNVRKGNMAAIKEYFRLVDRDDKSAANKTQAMEEFWFDIFKKLGLKSKEDMNKEIIINARGDNASEDVEDASFSRKKLPENLNDEEKRLKVLEQLFSED